MSIVAELKAKIADLEKQISAIQDQCNHPPLVTNKEPFRVKGDPLGGGDKFYYNCHCQLCDKRWQESQ